MLPNFKKGPGSTPSAASSGPPAPPKRDAPAVITPPCTLIGNLYCKGEVQFEGELQGDLVGDLVVIGEMGKITGSIIADDVVVRGHVVGSIRAKRLRVQATAQVEGDLICISVAIEEGALHEGRTRRLDPTSFEATRPAPPENPWQSATAAPAPAAPKPLAPRTLAQVVGVQPSFARTKIDDSAAVLPPPAVAISSPATAQAAEASAVKDELVFVSYSQADRAVAAELAAKLEARGFKVWYDAALGPGDSFSIVIQQHLRKASAVVVIWSQKSVLSNWVLSEAEYAYRRGMLVTLRVKDLGTDDIPMPYNLLHAETVDRIDAICHTLGKLGLRSGT